MAEREESGVAPESPFAHLSETETRAWFAYMKLHLRVHYELGRQLRDDSGLSLPEYDVLVALISDPDATLSITALATRLGWERSRVSHQLRRMVERGFVDTVTDAADRRSRTVRLTPAGRRALGDASPAHAAFVRRGILDALDADEQQQLAGLLERVYDRLIDEGTLPRPVDHP